MKNNDDRNLDGGDSAANNPLRDDMRRQAMAERQPFSDELHERIMQGIRNDHTDIPAPYPMRRWRLPAAIAAMLVVAMAMTAAWIMRPHVAPPLPIPIAHNETQRGAPHVDLQTAPTLAMLASDFSSLFSERQQPRLVLKVPIVTRAAERAANPAQQSPAPSPPPGSPEWLRARLEDSSRSAQATLNQVIPPEMKVLVALAQAHQ